MTAKHVCGYSLIELLIVVVILGLIAAIAVPNSTSSPDRSLDLAADEFAAAIRFARSESIRTGEPHGYTFDGGSKRIRVFRADMSTNPPTPIYDVYHPIDKNIYDIQLDQKAAADADTLTGSAIFRGSCTNPGIAYFDTNGTPWCGVPANVLLERGEITAVSGTEQRIITLDGITGRVTVQ